MQLCDTNMHWACNAPLHPYLPLPHALQPGSNQAKSPTSAPKTRSNKGAGGYRHRHPKHKGGSADLAQNTTAKPDLPPEPANRPRAPYGRDARGSVDGLPEPSDLIPTAKPGSSARELQRRGGGSVVAHDASQAIIVFAIHWLSMRPSSAASQKSMLTTCRTAGKSGSASP